MENLNILLSSCDLVIKVNTKGAIIELSPKMFA